MIAAPRGLGASTLEEGGPHRGPRGASLRSAGGLTAHAGGALDLQLGGVI